jgi:hypothetical protein
MTEEDDLKILRPARSSKKCLEGLCLQTMLIFVPHLYDLGTGIGMLTLEVHSQVTFQEIAGFKGGIERISYQ